MELLTDPFTGSLRVVAPERIKRLEQRVDGCPFCAGNEHATPVETQRIPAPDGATWAARAFPNLFPLAPLHEVLVPTPRHATSLRDLSVAELTTMLELWCARLSDVRDTSSDDAYAHLFVNDGAHAGASVPHVHAQLMQVATSPYIAEVLHRVRHRATCAACDVVATALTEDRLISQHADYVLATPAAPRLSGSMILTPRSHDLPLQASLALAEMMHIALRALPPYDFNVIVVSDPVHPVHWYFELIPRHGQLAGAELGLNMTVCMTDPRADAADARRRLSS